MKNQLLIGLTVFAAVLGISMLTPNHAAAHGCDVLATYGPDINDCSNEIGDENGMKISGNLRDNFISRVTHDLNHGGNNQRAGARYIIDHLGGSSKWKYAVGVATLKEETYQSCYNTFYNRGDNAIERDTTTGCGKYFSVVFYYKGNVVFAVKEDCGNPLGNLSFNPPIPRPTGAVRDACNNANGDFTFTASFDDSIWGETNAYLGTSGGGRLSDVAPSSPTSWNYNGAGAPLKYSPAVWNYGNTIYLWVQDVGNGGGYYRTASATRDDCAPTGAIGYSCDASGNANLSYRYADQDGPSNQTGAYTIVTNDASTLASSYAPSAFNSSWTYRSYGERQPVAQQVKPTTSTDNKHKALLYVLDNGPTGDGRFHYIASRQMNCSALPAGAISATCNAADILSYSGYFYDPDGATKATVKDAGVILSSPTSTNANTSYATRRVIPVTSAGKHAPGSVTLQIAVTNATGGPGTYVNSVPVTCPPTLGAVNDCGILSTTALSGSDTPEPGESFKVTAAVNYSSAATATAAKGGDTFTISANGASVAVPHTQLTIDPSTPTKVTGIAAFAAGLPATGQYPISVKTATPPAVDLSSAGCKMDVANKSYLQVYSGDVAAGVETPARITDTSCLPEQNDAGLLGWNSDNAATGYNGAGAHFGATAMDVIKGFASAQGSYSGDGLTGTGLSFANTDTANNKPALDTFGGSFGGAAGYSPSCNTTYTGAINSGTAPAGQATRLNTVVSTPIADGTHAVKYFSGDVYIENNVVYGSGTWTSLANVPSLTIVAVGGNIYVGSNVTELDGTYVAEPTGSVDTPVGGNVYTCATKSADSGNLTTPAVPADTVKFATCSGKQLVVNGSLIGQKINFDRACGSLQQSTPAEATVFAGGSNPANCNLTNHAAEVFNYGALDWFGNASATGGGNTGWESINSLPPVL